MSQSVLSTVSAAATGTLVVTDPLNFWAGKRVQPRGEKNAEPVFEPATGNAQRRPQICCATAFRNINFYLFIL